MLRLGRGTSDGGSMKNERLLTRAATALMLAGLFACGGVATPVQRR